MGLCRVHQRHERGQGCAEARAHGLDLLAPGAAGVLCHLLLKLGADLLQHRERRALEERRGLVRRPVHVLLQEALGGIGDLASEVSDAEFDGAGKLGHDESRVLLKGLENLAEEGLVCCLGHGHLLIQDGQDGTLGVQQGDNVGIVLEGDAGIYRDTLCLVVIQLHLENVVVEEQLQVLIAQVDKELLQGVCLEALEASNVQHAKILAVQCSAL
mmetsp:Transcript_98801/g.288207  ORF Transcript_98801/g.288207 Transcript_98801/m.288207 type:complete len:214 (+) Transcript_98801:3187-3828(+)